MRRWNVRLLVRLIAGLAVLSSGVFVLHKIMTQRSSAAYLHQADLVEKRGDKGKAAHYLELYLDYKPKDEVNVLKRIAELRVHDNIQGAMATLEKALVLDPARDDVRRRLVELYVSFGSTLAAMKGSGAVSAEHAARYEINATEAFSIALGHLKILAPSKDPQDTKDSGLQLLFGKCEEELGHPKEAAAHYEEARKLAPHEVDAYSLLGGLLRRTSFDVLGKMEVFGHAIQNKADQDATADKVMDELVKANGQSAPAYLARARYRTMSGLPGAIDDAAEALGLAPEDTNALWMTAVFKAASSGDEARRLLKRGIALNPTDARLYEALARVETTAGKLDEAIACLKAGIDKLPARTELTWPLVETLLVAGKTSEAAEAVEELSKTTFNPVLRDYLQARVEVGTRQWRRAVATLERIAPILANRGATERFGITAYVLLGQCYGYLNESDQRLSAYRRAAEIRRPAMGKDLGKMGSLDVEIQAGLASALGACGKVDEAIEGYRKILAQNPAVSIDLARLLSLREFRKPEAQRNWKDVEAVLDQAQKAMPGRPEVIILSAEVLAAQKKLDEACAKIKVAQEGQPERPDLWVELASLEQRQGHAEQAVNLLDKAEKHFGRLLALRIARVKYWTAHGGSDAVAALSALEKAASDLTRDDHKAFLGALFDAHTRLGNAALALEMGRKLAEEDRLNLNLRLILFERALQDGNETAADALVREISQIETSGDSDPERAQAPLTGYCEAVLAVRKGNFDAARSKLRKVAQLRPEWSRVPVVEAQINEKEAQINEKEKPRYLNLALTNYLRAIDMGERNPLIGLRTAELLSERTRYAEADLVLRRLEGQLSAAEDQQRIEIARALAQARAALVDKNDDKNHLRLGQVLSWAGRQASADGQKDQAAARFKEAETELRQAITLARSQPDAYVALMQVLAFAGRPDDARKVAADAEKALPNDQNALKLAQCYLLVGDMTKVKAFCHNAVTLAPENPDTLRTAAFFALRAGATDDAKNYLRRLTKLDAKAPSEAADALRVLALITAASGPGKIDEALALLGESHTPPQGQPGSTADDQSVKDQRTKARILAGPAIRERRRGAIAILEKLLKDGTAAVDDKTLLYALYRSDNDWPKARALMQRLLTDDPRNPNHLALYALDLIRHGLPAEAAPLVKRLEGIAADPRATIELKTRVDELQTRLLVAQGHNDEAVKQVRNFALSQPGHLLSGARLLEELGLPEPAEPLYRQFVAGSKDPEAPFVLAGSLARRGLLKNALDLCESAWPKCDVNKAATLSTQVLSQASPPDDASCRRVASWIDDAIRKKPTDQSLQFHRAYLCGLQGKYDEAERIYREIAAREKPESTNGAIFNNLAWLLSFQKGRGSEALEAIGRTIKIEGELSDFIDTRALAYMALGQFDAAIQDLENAVVMGPGPEKYFHLALAYHRVNKKENARQAFQKARELKLTRESLHPLERFNYDELAADNRNTDSGAR